MPFHRLACDVEAARALAMCLCTRADPEQDQLFRTDRLESIVGTSGNEDTFEPTDVSRVFVLIVKAGAALKHEKCVIFSRMSVEAVLAPRGVNLQTQLHYI